MLLGLTWKDGVMPRHKQRLMNTKAPVELTPERKLIVLDEMRKTGFQVISAEMAGVTPRTVQQHLSRDKEFAEAYQAALDFHTENVYVRAAEARAIEGVRKPIIGGKDRDQIVTHVREYSDTLLQTLMKSRKPEYNKGAGAEGAEGAGAPGGRAGGVLIVAQAPHSMEDWHALFGEKAKGTTGKQTP